MFRFRVSVRLRVKLEPRVGRGPGDSAVIDWGRKRPSGALAP